MKSKDLLVALFALGFVLLSWPFLTVVNRPWRSSASLPWSCTCSWCGLESSPSSSGSPAGGIRAGEGAAPMRHPVSTIARSGRSEGLRGAVAG